MYLYELIALRQPFEGHEAVKECILEGGRPLLSRRETYFPCNYLDLMVLCWDQLPKVRLYDNVEENVSMRNEHL